MVYIKLHLLFTIYKVQHTFEFLSTCTLLECFHSLLLQFKGISCTFFYPTLHLFDNFQIQTNNTTYNQQINDDIMYQF